MSATKLRFQGRRAARSHTRWRPNLSGLNSLGLTAGCERRPAKAGAEGLATAARFQAGFTLVEVLLTLLIMSGLLVMITQILTTARTTRDTIYNLRETQLAGPAILDLIERDLRAIYTTNRDPALALIVTDRVVGGMDADQIEFATCTNSLEPYYIGNEYYWSDVNTVAYRLRQQPEDRDFLEIYRLECFGINDQAQREPYVTFLHDRVGGSGGDGRGFNIEVFEEDGPDVDPVESWGTDSDEYSGLPASIKITLTLELAPRIQHEQLKVAPIRLRSVQYVRWIRFPQGLRLATEIQPVPTIPRILPPAEDVPQNVGDDPATGLGGSDFPPGGGDFELSSDSLGGDGGSQADLNTIFGGGG